MCTWDCAWWIKFWLSSDDDGYPCGSGIVLKAEPVLVVDGNGNQWTGRIALWISWFKLWSSIDMEIEVMVGLRRGWCHVVVKVGRGWLVDDTCFSYVMHSNSLLDCSCKFCDIML